MPLAAIGEDKLDISNCITLESKQLTKALLDAAKSANECLGYSHFLVLDDYIQ